MESSMPLPSPSPTPLNQGLGPTALLLEQSCGHIAPLHHHQHLHPLRHHHWGGSQIPRGLTAVLILACRRCHSNTCPVWVLLVMCMCAFSDSVRKCVHILCTEAHGPVSNCTHIADSAALHQRARYGNHQG